MKHFIPNTQIVSPVVIEAIVFGSRRIASGTYLVVDASHLMGDYNRDQKVDAADYVVWRKTVGTSVTTFSGADGSGNGIIDNPDYEEWKTYFGDTMPAAVSGSGTADDDSSLSSSSVQPHSYTRENVQMRTVLADAWKPQYNIQRLRVDREMARIPRTPSFNDTRDLIAILGDRFTNVLEQDDRFDQFSNELVCEEDEPLSDSYVSLDSVLAKW